MSSNIGELELEDFTVIVRGLLVLAKNIINTKILNEPYPISKQVLGLVEVVDGSVDLKEGYGTVGLNIESEL